MVFSVNVYVCVYFCTNTKEVCVCVYACSCLKSDPGASWIHEGPLSCPQPIRCLTWIVLLESSASSCQIFVVILNRLLCCEVRNTDDSSHLCVVLSVKLLRINRKHTLCQLVFLTSPTHGSSETFIQSSGEIHMKLCHMFTRMQYQSWLIYFVLQLHSFSFF